MDLWVKPGDDGEHATGSPLKAYGSESESGWGFDIPGPCIQLASINLEGGAFLTPGAPSPKRGCSSAGRAPDLHSGGRRFDPDQLHQCWRG